MAAPDVRFEAVGKPWTLRFGFTAWCSVEEQYDEPFMYVLARCFPEIATGEQLTDEQLVALKMNAKVSDMRAVIYAGLCHHHDGITMKQVAEIVDDIGIDKVGDLLNEALKGSQEGGEKAKKGPRKAPPRKGSTPTR